MLTMILAVWGAVVGTTTAAYTIWRDYRTIRSGRKADLRAAFVKTGSRDWCFRISNVGPAPAHNAPAHFMSGQGAIIASEIEEKFPIAMLEPGDRRDLIAAPHYQSDREQKVKLLWADGASKSNEKTLNVQLF